MVTRIAAVLLVFGVLAAASAAEAQTSRLPRVAVLEAFSTAEAQQHTKAFLDRMRELGYIDGRNVIFDLRTSDRDRTKVSALVDELLALKPDVLVSDSNAVQLLRAKTTSIPIVLATMTDPVSHGLAGSLARPGKNVTGTAILLDELVAKHIEIMREIRPRLARVGMLDDTTGTGCKGIEAATSRPHGRLA